MITGFKKSNCRNLAAAVSAAHQNLPCAMAPCSLSDFIVILYPSIERVRRLYAHQHVIVERSDINDFVWLEICPQKVTT